MIASYVGENAEFERQMLSGELGSIDSTRNLGQLCRAAQHGIPAVWLKAGIGTEVAEGKKSESLTVKLTFRNGLQS